LRGRLQIASQGSPQLSRIGSTACGLPIDFAHRRRLTKIGVLETRCRTPGQMNPQLFDIPAMWLGIGLLGQALFSLRFIVQWIASERQRRSVIPAVFWQFSLAGGITLLVYAIHRRDPVFILGQVTGIVVYLRNLHFVRREGRRPAEPPSEHRHSQSPAQ
jgi:lipid-A-disaccharide synthase-like uncharacterized protein